jgi:hypothetical protein
VSSDVNTQDQITCTSGNVVLGVKINPMCIRFGNHIARVLSVLTIFLGLSKEEQDMHWMPSRYSELQLFVLSAKQKIEVSESDIHTRFECGFGKLR